MREPCACETLESRVLFARMVGVDVSTYQGNINWTKVAGAGKDFAIIRATAGLNTDDDQFLNNVDSVTGAKEKGLYVGFYHYAYYDTDSTHTANAEADHFFDQIKPYLVADGKTLNPVLDVEEPLRDGWDNADLATWVNNWCKRVRNRAQSELALSLTPIIYTGSYRATSVLNQGESQSQPLWVAEWPSTIPDPQTANPSTSGDWQDWAFWQYTSNGHVNGIGDGTTSRVDLDVLNGDEDVLQDYVIGGVGRWPDGTWVKADSSGGLKAWVDPTANPDAPYSDTYTLVPNNTLGTVIQGPVYGNGYEQWQIQYANGVTGWSAEGFLDTVTPGAAKQPTPANNVVAGSVPDAFTWTAAHATSYDVYRDGVKRSTVTTASWNHDALTSGSHSWQIVTHNGSLTTAGPVWNFTVDTAPPIANVTATSPAGGSTAITFTVLYADAISLVNSTTLNTGDVTVSGPKNFLQTATFVSATPAGNASQVTATYSINAPGGTWDAPDNGSYTISQAASQVFDTLGNARPAGMIGSFMTNLPAAPIVQSVVIGDGTTQRSMVKQITVTFDSAVTLDADAFTLTGRNGAGAGTGTQWSNPSSDGRTWLLSFSGSPIIGGSLADGVYDLVIAASRVHAVGAPGITMAADHAVTFHRLFGDSNGDKIVNNGDSFKFTGSYLKSSGASGFQWYLDWTGDGSVNNSDNFQFSKRYLQSLPY